MAPRFPQFLRTVSAWPQTVRAISPLALVLAACTGDPGAPGAAGDHGSNALVTTTDEPAGGNCAHGGKRIDAGVDSNDNGMLDASEVQSTSYICNATGSDALVRTGVEPAGANCPFGGTRIDSGVDANANGILDDSEVGATSYVCQTAPNGSIDPSTGIAVAYKQQSTDPAQPISVRFTLKDDRGFPIDIHGAYSVNTAIQPRFAIGYFTTDANGIVSPLTVYTKATSTAVPAGQPTSYSPVGATNQGTLVENGYGAGDYTYTFPTTSTTNGPQAVAYDPSKLGETHAIWIQVSRQTDLVFSTNANTYYAANAPDYFVPNNAHPPTKREIAAQSGCDGCHAKFKAETTASSAFHGGGRVDVGMCNVCHNPARTSNPQASSASFVHRIHNGEQVADANRFHGIAASYPQDIRNCNQCHGNAAQGAQALTNPTTLACQGCHDYVSFTNTAPAACQINGTLKRDANGLPVPCNHVGGPQPDAACATCHGPGGTFATTRYHKPVVPPDPGNLWAGGTNPNTNASWVAAASYVPPGANVITYNVKSVDAVLDTSVTPNVLRPQITFKLLRDGANAVFQDFATGMYSELLPNFVGAPSVYFAFAVPQDKIAAPADFNASASGYLRSIWNHTATGTGAGTLSGPDADGYYTVRLTGVVIPAAATMLTGGVGYTYSLSGTPPLVQTNLADYEWIPDVPADGKAQGGLSVPSPDVWKVATGYAARRTIVDTAKCNACHAGLGVAPTFHAGARNDAPTCSFCHTSNRTSSGWAAGSKYFIHAIHGGRQRTVPYTWHAEGAGESFDEVEFPGTLNTCTTCHVANSFDFTNKPNLDAIPNMTVATVATGTYSTDPKTNSAYYTVSPYVVADGVTSYGAGFAYNAATGASTDAAGTTLVMTPITGVCSACHDSTTALAHMRGNGGVFYGTRSTTLANGGGAQEQCMICHGPGRTAAIGLVHQH